MSMRSDYELTVTVMGDGNLTLNQLDTFANNTPHAFNICGPDDEPGYDDYLQTDQDRKGFFLVLHEIHPEEMWDPILTLSKAAPNLILKVEEYIREATEMVEAGRETYLLQNGEVFIDPDSPEGILQRIYDTLWPPEERDRAWKPDTINTVAEIVGQWKEPPPP